MGQIRNDEHVFIAGMTGSGKTFLAEHYLVGVNKPVFVLDTKGMFDWEIVPADKKIIVTHLEELPEADRKFDRIIYRPAREELDPIFYNAFYEYCYYRGNCTAVTDEVMQVCPSPSRIPEYYKGILTRGRELNVNAWSLTQRPATIPVVIYSESTHWFIFKLNNKNDRKRLAEFTGYDQLLDTVPMYIFNYFNAKTSAPPRRGTLKVKGG